MTPPLHLLRSFMFPWMSHWLGVQRMLKTTPEASNVIRPKNDNDVTPDEQSFRNIVEFYKDELMKIEEGEKATQYFNDRQRKTLVKSGILNRVYGRGGCRLRLSRKAKKVLSQLDPYSPQ
ncbi:MAG: hypothetical protein NWE89_04690 [Candidatus Bathyarchaeota archaeon]|nr:hypothetical protein [Candidatus Bathyarchaeota archaeon]